MADLLHGSSIRCFKHFISPVAANIAKPIKFTFPFYYQPHALAALASQELQNYLTEQDDWQHQLGITDNANGAGKMFGVLVVEKPCGELGYLAAFSGMLANQNELTYFVPPVYDITQKDDFFIEKQAIINQINQQVNILESNPELAALQGKIKQLTAQQQSAIAEFQLAVQNNRKERKRLRSNIHSSLSGDELAQAMKQLSQESIDEKKQLKKLKADWEQKLSSLEVKLSALENEITQLKKQRKKLSATLQKKLFKQYTFLNADGEEESLYSIFQRTPHVMPPAGAGECAAPKLLQYAFLHQLTPIAMAEFWWGAAPESEIRHHGNFYPSCNSKCQPILGHMLTGLTVDDNPLLTNPAENKHFEVLYEDDTIVVINKPAEFLSVPGKHIQDSVYTRMKTLYPQAAGPIIVHRLDMSTSGLMVLTLNKDANKKLQQQFIKRIVEKRYVALLEGVLNTTEGTVTLPLRVDLDDRPRQLVCYQYGKTAETFWQLIEQKENRTKVYFYPKTGRTHQLRIHSAHAQGLNAPIVGDDHYGQSDKRLCLHAESLSFIHPTTGETMKFQCDADF